VLGERTIAMLGARAIAIAREVGGIAILTGQVLRALVPPRLDGRELVRNLHRMGNRSVPIVALTAFFAGGLMVVQSAPFVNRLGATSLAGWAAGYAVLREIGPILIGLMFSGRVGANNTAELGTMTVTEQLDGLRALAIDPIRYLIVPRVLAMLVMLTALTIIGDLVALVGAVAGGAPGARHRLAHHVRQLRRQPDAAGLLPRRAQVGRVRRRDRADVLLLRRHGQGRRGRRRPRGQRRGGGRGGVDHAARLLHHLRERMSAPPSLPVRMVAAIGRPPVAAARATRSSCGWCWSARSPG
jgi:hypothetical protein